MPRFFRSGSRLADGRGRCGQRPLRSATTTKKAEAPVVAPDHRRLPFRAEKAADLRCKLPIPNVGTGGCCAFPHRQWAGRRQRPLWSAATTVSGHCGKWRAPPRGVAAASLKRKKAPTAASARKTHRSDCCDTSSLPPMGIRKQGECAFTGKIKTSKHRSAVFARSVFRKSLPQSRNKPLRSVAAWSIMKIEIYSRRSQTRAATGGLP